MTARLPQAPSPALPAAWPATPPWAWLAGAAASACGPLAAWLLDGRLDVANQALLWLLGGVVGSLWLPLPAALALGLAGMAGFNWALVPPRGSFSIDSPQNALMLGVMLALHSVAATLMARLRAQAALARQHQQRADELRRLADTLRDATEPLAHAGALQQALATLSGAPVALLLLRQDPPATGADTAAADGVMALGPTDADEAAGLWHALRQGQAMGPGTGHHESLARWYLPLRGAGACRGAALLRLHTAGRDAPALRQHAQALCDLLGQALQRQASQRAEQAAQTRAQDQAVRNALLAAISHDYRTPLATMLGAASSLAEQDARLDAAQRQRLAGRIVHEVQHLARLTDNTLQLARLDAPGVTLRLDWESPEEIVATVLQRARLRAPGRALRARLEPGLPLLRCDALLLAQLLDNLVDNALKHTAPDSPVELLVRREPADTTAARGLDDTLPAPAAGWLVLAVRDRGHGVPPAWRERIFEVFQRGEPAADGVPRPGSGVGLAVCRAIARAHGGTLRLRARAHGGSAFECRIPLAEPPAPPTETQSAAGPA